MIVFKKVKQNNRLYCIISEKRVILSTFLCFDKYVVTTFNVVSRMFNYISVAIVFRNPYFQMSFYYVDVWSSTATWGGAPVPAADEFIVIPEGQVILLDQSTDVLAMVLIDGKVCFTCSVRVHYN